MGWSTAAWLALGYGRRCDGIHEVLAFGDCRRRGDCFCGHSADQIFDLSESVDETEEDVELIQRELILRAGETRLQVQRIENEQRSQGQDLEKILLLLQQQQARTGQ